MPPEETAVKLTLDKPLNELTEDDIAQLTREDCRRYLKEKGMRRPSWNKSQAIQQVIMLKTLLETTPDSDDGLRKKLRSNTSNPETVTKGTNGDAENSASAEETAAHRVKDPEKPDCSGGLSGRFAAANDESAHIRPTDSMNMPVGQLTIFYCGKINVYDDVPADKAQAILQTAANPFQFPEGELAESTKIVQPLPCMSNAVSTKAHQDSVAVALPTLQAVKVMSDKSLVLGEENNMLHEDTLVEGPSTRKASVQRYLEKRKDRFKSKRKAGETSCASSDMYFNYHMNNHMPRSNTFYPPQIRPSSTPSRCSSVDSDSVKNLCLSTSLSNQGL